LKHTCLLILLALSGAAAGEGFGLKPGLWEVSVVRQVMDGRDVTEQMAATRRQMAQQMQAGLANMPPERRKQMEAMLKGSGDMGGPIRVCVSAAMAAIDQPMVDPEGHCEPSKVAHSGNRTTFEFNCMSNGVGNRGRGESVANGDTISVHNDVTTTTPQGSHTMQIDTSMKFQGRDCQGIKPFDELRKEFNSPPATK